METAAFDYDLPPERVAQRPVEPRDAARLLVDRGAGAGPGHATVADLPDLVEPGDLLVVNETRVLRARLPLEKDTGGAVEVLLLERDDATGVWEALVRPSRKVRSGTRVTSPRPGVPAGAAVEVGDDLGEGRRHVRIVPGGDAGDAGPERLAAELAVVDAMGDVPLPPYITEPLADPERYQTVYARRPASSAAPTAGLHLTPAVLERLVVRGVGLACVELVVGLGTFRPITAEHVEDHTMHIERYRVPSATWAAVADTHARGNRVVAVGTTAVRALESVAAGRPLEGHTDLFIRSGHRFGAVDRMLTNFHQPRSSLLVLIDAFVGPRWRDLYDEALARDYRFLSFGDAMLLTRADLA